MSQVASRRTGGHTIVVGLFRVLVSLHLLLLCVQPVLAGLFLGGDFNQLERHNLMAGIVITVAMVQIVVAILVWRPGRWSAWPIPISVAMFLAEGIQMGAGYTRNLGLHVPLGVGLVVAGALLAVWACSPARRGAAVSTELQSAASPAPAAEAVTVMS